MPILNIQLADQAYSDGQLEQLMVRCSQFYAEVLKSPIERVRVFIQLHRPALVAVAGVPVSRSGVQAPYFHFLVLEGRSLEERQRLLTGFTDLLVEVLGAERGLIRGGCWPISPENWAIGGVPASVTRAAEVQARAQQAAASSA
jgi:phenylpyruvate tautomerase PptA (4-oxalocrotonate tautomerase family)